MSDSKGFEDGRVISWPDGSSEPFMVGRLIGLEEAFDALSDDGLPALSGVKVARYVVGELLNREKSVRLGVALRHAATNGVDIATHEVASSGAGILVWPLDLVERAQ